MVFSFILNLFKRCFKRNEKRKVNTYEALQIVFKSLPKKQWMTFSLINKECNKIFRDQTYRYASVLAAKWRGIQQRNTEYPNILRAIRDYLSTSKLKLCNEFADGRVNSSVCEEIIIEKLLEDERFANRIWIPKIRHWFDLAIKIHNGQWRPVNIKVSTMKSSDNVGNFSLCTYSYTNHPMELTKPYVGRDMAETLIESLKAKRYNIGKIRDYYFLVVDKKDSSNIIINSMLKLNDISFSKHNMPFQVRWKHNTQGTNMCIRDIIDKFIEVYRGRAEVDYKTVFLHAIQCV
jgi:hypothetical protein